MRKGRTKFFAALMCVTLAACDLMPISAAQQEATPGEAVTEEAVMAEDATEDIFVEENIRTAGTSYYDSVEDGEVTEDGYYIRKVSKKEMNANEKALQIVLNEAAENATAKAPYKVVVEPADYTVSPTFVISSNTFLYLDGVTFKQVKGGARNVLKVGDPSFVAKETGFCYENITIYGGTFDKNGNAGTTTIKVGHAANFTMEKTVLKNTKNAHFMEIGGVNGFTLRGCQFQKVTVDSSSSIGTFESVQFDVLVEGHISGYEYEDIASRNILVEDCTFQDVSAGVGSHNAILNNPVRDIIIRNNTFQNLKSVAISFMDARNCTITGNKITAAPRGIMMRSIQEGGVFFGSTLNKNSKISNKYKQPEKDQQIVISGNTISCSGKDAANYTTCCIFILGQNITKSKKPSGSGDKVPKGNYYISGAVISNNTLTTADQGIVLTNTRNSTIDSNTVTDKGKGNKNGMIMLMGASTDNRITKNIIGKASYNAISLHSDSSAKLIADNTLTEPGYCGIFVESSTAETISGNKVSKAKGIGIALDPRAGAKAITKNTVTSAGGGGINIANTKTNLEISGNTVKSCGSSQIFINCAANKTITVSKNKLTGKSGSDGILCTSGTIFVSNNTITSGRFAILLTSNVKGTVVYNTCKKNQTNDLSIDWASQKYMSKPTSVKAKASGKRAATVSWKAVKGAAGYQVFRATKANGTYTKVATVKKTSYKDSKLKAKKTYYYKVVAYKNSSNNNLAIGSDYSKQVSVKTK